MDEYLTDAEITSLDDQQIYWLSFLHYVDSETFSEAVLIRRDFMIARLLDRAQACERQAVAHEQTAASRPPRARSHVPQDRKKAAVQRDVAAKFRAAAEQLQAAAA